MKKPKSNPQNGSPNAAASQVQTRPASPLRKPRTAGRAGHDRDTKKERAGRLRFFDNDSREVFGEFLIEGEDLESLFNSAAAASLTVGQFILHAIREKSAAHWTRRSSRFLTAVLPDYVTYNRLAAMSLAVGADQGRLAGFVLQNAVKDKQLDECLRMGLEIVCTGQTLLKSDRRARRNGA